MIDYRNRHHRIDSHFGETPATLVELGAAIDTIPAEMTIEDVLALLHERFLRAEDSEIRLGWFRADAALVVPTFLADAIIKKAISGSYTANAVIERIVGQSITADATIETGMVSTTLGWIGLGEGSLGDA